MGQHPKTNRSKGVVAQQHTVAEGATRLLIDPDTEAQREYTHQHQQVTFEGSSDEDDFDQNSNIESHPLLGSSEENIQQTRQREETSSSVMTTKNSAIEKKLETSNKRGQGSSLGDSVSQNNQGSSEYSLGALASFHNLFIYRGLIFTISLSSMILWGFFYETKRMKPWSFYESSYIAFVASCADIAVVEYFISALYLIISLVQNLHVMLYLLNFIVWLTIFPFGKLWAYRGWHLKESMYDSIGYSVSLVFDVLRLFLACRLYFKHHKNLKVITVTPSIDQYESMFSESENKVSVKAIFMILRPYLIPTGVRNKFFVVLTWITMIASKTCVIVAPMYISKAVSNIIQTDPDPSYMVISIYALLIFLPGLLKEIQDILYTKVWQMAYTQVAELTFIHVHSLSLDWHLRKRHGPVIRSIDRGQRAADILMYHTILNIFPTILAAMGAFTAFVVKFDQKHIAAICFLGFFSYLWSTFLVTKWRRKYKSQANKHDDQMHDKASDSLINFQTVKYFTNEDFEIKQYVKHVTNYQKGSFKTQGAISFLNATQNVTTSGTLYISLLIAGYTIVNVKEFDAGGFVAVVQYVTAIFDPLWALGFVYNEIINRLIDLQNLVILLAVEPDITDAPGAIDYRPEYVLRAKPGSPKSSPRDAAGGSLTPIPALAGGDVCSTTMGQPATSVVLISQSALDTLPASQSNKKNFFFFRSTANNVINTSINYNASANHCSLVQATGSSVEFRNVSFSYPSQLSSQGIKNVSFTVPPGTMIALVGETGAGKSTINHLLFRFYDVHAGNILIDGRDIRSMTQKSLRKLIGVVPQECVLFNESIKYNIKYGKIDATDKEMKQAAQRAQIDDFICSLKKGYDTQVGERGLKMSGGEKQRIAVARCLLKDPPIVVLDEATSSLDNSTEKRLQEALKLLMGRTTLVIAHRLTTITHADQILVLRGGRIIQRGKHDELLADNDGYYKCMWDAQLVGREGSKKGEGYMMGKEG